MLSEARGPRLAGRRPRASRGPREYATPGHPVPSDPMARLGRAGGGGRVGHHPGPGSRWRRSVAPLRHPLLLAEQLAKPRPALRGPERRPAKRRAGTSRSTRRSACRSISAARSWTSSSRRCTRVWRDHPADAPGPVLHVPRDVRRAPAVPARTGCRCGSAARPCTRRRCAGWVALRPRGAPVRADGDDDVERLHDGAASRRPRPGLVRADRRHPRPLSRRPLDGRPGRGAALGARPAAPGLHHDRVQAVDVLGRPARRAGHLPHRRPAVREAAAARL